MSDYDDPPEFTGADNTTRAEPIKSAAAAAAPVIEAPEPVADTPSAAPAVAPVAEPVAEVDVCPFDAMGRITAPPDEAVAALKPEKRARLMAMLKANIETEDAEQNVRDIDKAISAAIGDAQRKRAHYYKLQPQTTFLEEHRRVIAARAGRPIPPPTVHPQAEAAARAVDEAEALIGQLRIDLTAAQAIMKSKRGVLAAAILGWQGVQPKRTTADLIRERSQKERDHALAVIRGEIEPDAEPEHVHQEPIDAALSGYRGSANARYGRPAAFIRGERPPVRSSTSRQY